MSLSSSKNATGAGNLPGAEDVTGAAQISEEQAEENEKGDAENTEDKGDLKNGGEKGDTKDREEKNGVQTNGEGKNDEQEKENATGYDQKAEPEQGAQDIGITAEDETQITEDVHQHEEKETTGLRAEEQAEEDGGQDPHPKERGQEPVNIDLSRMKTLYQFRNRPTLPYLLTEYGLEDKEVPVVKPKHKQKKKRKRGSFGDDSGRDKEREKLQEERHLQILTDMAKLRDFYYDEYTTLLQNKVAKQRHDIRQRSRALHDKINHQEETTRQESHHVKRRLEHHTFVSDDSFLKDLPRSDLFYIVQLQDKLIKEGTLKSQTDFDTFWERIQQPDIFYMYFKVPKSDEFKKKECRTLQNDIKPNRLTETHCSHRQDKKESSTKKNPTEIRKLNDLTVREDFNENASSRGTSTWKGSSSTLRGSESRNVRSPPPADQKGGPPRALSRIAESRESSRPATRLGHHWAITQQFPAHNREQLRERRRSSLLGLKPPPAQQKSSFLQDLEKRFPKLEMPKLHCFSMNLGPKAADPDEVRHQCNLQELEKNRKKYSYKLTKMHQLAMANAAAASRILEMHEDMDFIINGAPLTDLISDQHFYSGLPAARGVDGEVPSCSSPVQNDQLRPFTLPSLLEQEEGPASTAVSAARKSAKKSGSGKSKRSQKSPPQPPDDKPAPSPPIPLSMGEITDNSRVVEAKCMSTLWTNYMKEVPSANS